MAETVTGTFSDSARARISAVTRRVENSALPPAGGGNLPMGGVPYYEAPVLLGKAPSNITKGNSGTVNIYRGLTKGSETYTSGDDKTCYARAMDITAGKWVTVFRINGGDSNNTGGYEVAPYEC